MGKRRFHISRFGIAAALSAVGIAGGCQSGASHKSSHLAHLDSGAAPVLPSELMHELALRSGKPAVVGQGELAYGRNDGLLGSRGGGGPITFSYAETSVFDHQHTFDGRVVDHYSRRTRIERVTAPR